MTQPSEDDRTARRAELRRRRQAAAARRRRYALLAMAALVGIAGAIVGSRAGDDGDGDTDRGSVATTPPPPSCPREIATSPRLLVGQKLVVRMEDEATAALRRAVRRGEIGGVILFPTPGSSTRALAKQLAGLRAAASAGGLPAPLVMIDQEGGEVKRLPEAPPDRSPGELAEAGPAAARAAGAATGRVLERLGIDVDLAPVLDLPSSADSFIASRAFGGDPAQVAATGTAFADGLQREGVAATAKHFPGLGTAVVNTDEAPSPIDASRAELAEGLEPFRAAIQGQVGLTMVSNATYPAYDESRPASQSRRVIEGLLRRRLGFQGVVITDDLGAGALVGAGIGEAEAAVGAAAAGADLLLFALSDGAEARAALMRALRGGQLDRARLVRSCERVTALRAGFSRASGA